MARLNAAAVYAAIAGLFAVQDARADDEQARAWAASCASCHPVNAGSRASLPRLVGRPKQELLAQLQAFKHGSRNGSTIMHQYAVGYSDAELERLADYLSRQGR